MGDANDPMMKRLSKLDAAAIILKANRDIKYIKGALETRPISELKAGAVYDNGKSFSNQLEIYPGGYLICKLETQERKAPLRLTLEYCKEKKDEPETAISPERKKSTKRPRTSIIKKGSTLDEKKKRMKKLGILNSD